MRPLLLVLGLVAVVAVVPGTAAADPGTSADNACAQADGLDRGPVGLLDGSNESIGDGDAVALYPGTTVYVAYCDGNDADNIVAWGLDSHPGLGDVSPHDKFYRVTVTSEADRISFPNLVQQRNTADGLTIQVRRGTPVETALADGMIPFGDTRGSQYAEAEAQFENGTTDVDAALAEMNRSSDRLASGETVLDDRTNRSMIETLDRLNRSYTETKRSGDRAQTMLFERQTEPALPPSDRATTAMGEIETRQSDVENRSGAALSAYEERVRAVENRAKQSILLQLGGGVFAGLLVGGIAGGYGPWTSGKRAAFDRDFGGSGYDRSVLRTPAIVGVAFLLLGLALAVATGLLGAIL